MTSPAQLNYLDAMGIPVWVSRDRVQDLVVQGDSENDSNSNLTEALQNTNVANKVHEHVGSLINDLDAIKQSTSEQSAPSSQLNSPVYSQSPATRKSQNSSADNEQAVDINIETDKNTTEIGRTKLHVIYACGNLNADWLVIGESPDVSNNPVGQPYAGESGILLSKMLAAVGVKDARQQAYLINVLKQPLESDSDTLKAANKHLNQQLTERIKQIKPKIIFVMGQVAAQNLLDSDEPLARLRGKNYTFANSNIPLVVSYYPSYLLSKPIDKRKAWDDLKQAMSLLS